MFLLVFFFMRKVTIIGTTIIKTLIVFSCRLYLGVVSMVTAAVEQCGGEGLEH